MRIRCQVQRGSRTADVLHIDAQPGDREALSRALRRWLEAERYDPAMWDDFTITAPGVGGFAGLVEVGP